MSPRSTSEPTRRAALAAGAALGAGALGVAPALAGAPGPGSAGPGSPAPGEPAFVEVGSRINVGQTVCILEAMKLMNELESEVGGEVVEILVDNGTPVEFGQVLMRVKPA